MRHTRCSEKDDGTVEDDSSGCSRPVPIETVVLSDSDDDVPLKMLIHFKRMRGDRAVPNLSDYGESARIKQELCEDGPTEIHQGSKVPTQAEQIVHFYNDNTNGINLESCESGEQESRPPPEGPDECGSDDIERMKLADNGVFLFEQLTKVASTSEESDELCSDTEKDVQAQSLEELLLQFEEMQPQLKKKQSFLMKDILNHQVPIQKEPCNDRLVSGPKCKESSTESDGSVKRGDLCDINSETHVNPLQGSMLNNKNIEFSAVIPNIIIKSPSDVSLSFLKSQQTTHTSPLSNEFPDVKKKKQSGQSCPELNVDLQASSERIERVIPKSPVGVLPKTMDEEACVVSTTTGIIQDEKETPVRRRRVKSTPLRESNGVVTSLHQSFKMLYNDVVRRRNYLHDNASPDGEILKFLKDKLHRAVIVAAPTIVEAYNKVRDEKDPVSALLGNSGVKISRDIADKIVRACFISKKTPTDSEAIENIFDFEFGANSEKNNEPVVENLNSHPMLSSHQDSASSALQSQTAAESSALLQHQVNQFHPCSKQPSMNYTPYSIHQLLSPPLSETKIKNQAVGLQLTRNSGNIETSVQSSIRKRRNTTDVKHPRPRQPKKRRKTTDDLVQQFAVPTTVQDLAHSNLKQSQKMVCVNPFQESPENLNPPAQPFKIPLSPSISAPSGQFISTEYERPTNFTGLGATYSPISSPEQNQALLSPSVLPTYYQASGQHHVIKTPFVGVTPEPQSWHSANPSCQSKWDTSALQEKESLEYAKTFQGYNEQQQKFGTMRPQAQNVASLAHNYYPPSLHLPEQKVTDRSPVRAPHKKLVEALNSRLKQDQQRNLSQASPTSVQNTLWEHHIAQQLHEGGQTDFNDRQSMHPHQEHLMQQKATRPNAPIPQQFNVYPPEAAAQQRNFNPSPSQWYNNHKQPNAAPNALLTSQQLPPQLLLTNTATSYYQTQHGASSQDFLLAQQALRRRYATDMSENERYYNKQQGGMRALYCEGKQNALPPSQLPLQRQPSTISFKASNQLQHLNHQFQVANSETSPTAFPRQSPASLPHETVQEHHLSQNQATFQQRYPSQYMPHLSQAPKHPSSGQRKDQLLNPLQHQSQLRMQYLSQGATNTNSEISPTSLPPAGLTQEYLQSQSQATFPQRYPSQIMPGFSEAAKRPSTYQKTDQVPNPLQHQLQPRMQDISQTASNEHSQISPLPQRSPVAIPQAAAKECHQSQSQATFQQRNLMPGSNEAVKQPSLSQAGKQLLNPVQHLQKHDLTREASNSGRSPSQPVQKSKSNPLPSSLSPPQYNIAVNITQPLCYLPPALVKTPRGKKNEKKLSSQQSSAPCYPGNAHPQKSVSVVSPGKQRLATSQSSNNPLNPTDVERKAIEYLDDDSRLSDSPGRLTIVETPARELFSPLSTPFIKQIPESQKIQHARALSGNNGIHTGSPTELKLIQTESHNNKSQGFSIESQACDSWTKQGISTGSQIAHPQLCPHQDSQGLSFGQKVQQTKRKQQPAKERFSADNSTDKRISHTQKFHEAEAMKKRKAVDKWVPDTTVVSEAENPPIIKHKLVFSAPMELGKIFRDPSEPVICKLRRSSSDAWFVLPEKVKSTNGDVENEKKASYLQSNESEPVDVGLPTLVEPDKIFRSLEANYSKQSAPRRPSVSSCSTEKQRPPRKYSIDSDVDAFIGRRMPTRPVLPRTAAKVTPKEVSESTSTNANSTAMSVRDRLTYGKSQPPDDKFKKSANVMAVKERIHREWNTTLKRRPRDN